MSHQVEHDAHGLDAADAGPGEHVASVGSYLAVWGVLMVLTALTVGASLVNLGSLNLPLALGIATVKAALVALFFMHLFYDDRFNLVVLATGFLFVVVFAALTLGDMVYRGAIYSQEGREIKPPAAIQAPPNPQTQK
jgi:cytochrome c oxidase subunit 4